MVRGQHTHLVPGKIVGGTDSLFYFLSPCVLSTRLNLLSLVL